jgi:hypothetical protein
MKQRQQIHAHARTASNTYRAHAFDFAAAEDRRRRHFSPLETLREYMAPAFTTEFIFMRFTVSRAAIGRQRRSQPRLIDTA